MRHEEFFWAERARTGDSHAFGLLAERYLPKLRKWIGSRVGQDKIDDLCQETLLQAFESIESLSNPDRFSAWLRGISLNVIRMHYRHHSKEHIVYLNEKEEVYAKNINSVFKDLPEKKVEEKLRTDQIAEALTKVTQKYQEVLTLFYLNEMSYKEISMNLGISISAVKSRMFRGRKLIKTQLSRTEEALMQETQRLLEANIQEVYRSEMEDKEPLAIIILKVLNQRNFLPIWVGEGEGQAILMILRGETAPRPLTHNLMTSLLEAAGVKVERVVVTKLKNEVFHSEVRIRGRNGEVDVDARPSDAIALALGIGVPIFIEQGVLEAAGIEDYSEEVLCSRFKTKATIMPLELPNLDDWWQRFRDSELHENSKED